MKWEASDWDEEDEAFPWESGDLGDEDEDDDFDWGSEDPGGESERLDALDRRALRIARREVPDSLERSLWLDLWRAPVLDAIEEQGIGARFYGPIQATVAATLPETPLLNLLLGAAEPGAVRGGHLEGALEWIFPTWRWGGCSSSMSSE